MRYWQDFSLKTGIHAISVTDVQAFLFMIIGKNKTNEALRKYLSDARRKNSLGK